MRMATCMRKVKLCFWFCLLAFSAGKAYWWDHYDLSKTAVVSVSVSDMLLNVASYYTSAIPRALYKSLPLSCEPTGFPCVRVHQMLFNELFFDVLCMNDECSGKVPYAYYGYNVLKRQPLNSYCLLSTNIIFLDELAKRKLLKFIPVPSHLNRNSSKIVTLKLPWKDKQTGLKFSAGTRFVRAVKHDREKSFAVRYIDFEKLKPVSAFIPKERCMIYEKHTSLQLRSDFIGLIRLWINHAAPRIIPYVLGGSCYLCGVDDTRPYLKEQSILGQKAAVYKRKETNKPCWGFDCSELIWRAAQIVGIDYPWKSSLMVERFLKPLKKGQRLEHGDIIWIPGHVMIVSDVKDNLLIESVGYKSGFGKVHEIALKDRIQGCPNYSILVRMLHEQKKLRLIGDKMTKCVHESCQFKILKLPV